MLLLLHFMGNIKEILLLEFKMDKLMSFIIAVLFVIAFLFSVIYLHEGLVFLAGAFILVFFFYLVKKV